MATFRQKKAIKEVVGNGGNITKAMIKAGYSPETANTPSKLTKSKGFLELCDELGLTDTLLVESLVSDIKGKPLNRHNELSLMAKLKGKLTDKVNMEIKSPTPILGGLSNSTVEPEAKE
jgi:hypothetical protein